jgi:hypothetical protein
MKLRLFIANEWTTQQWMSTLKSINSFYISYLYPELFIEEVKFDNIYQCHLLEEIVKKKAYFYYETGIGYDDDDRYYRAVSDARGEYQFMLANLAEDFIPLNKRLRVDSVTFSSPGYQDLIGVGEALKQIKEFILGLMEGYRKHKLYTTEQEKLALDNEWRKLKIDQLRIKLKSHELKYIEQYLELVAPFGELDLQENIIIRIKAVETIKGLIDSGNISGVQLLDKSEE